jgi:hypothetical protein
MITVALALLVMAPAPGGGGLGLHDLLLPGRGPAAVHYRARYRGADGAWHAVEVWRDGQRQVRRRTDGRLEIHARRPTPGAAPSLVVVDLQARAAYAAEPGELLQAGLLTDWNELAHSLARPRPGDRLTASARAESTAMGRCRVYQLTQAGGHRSSLCWSARWQLPLLIRDAARRPVFVLESADDRPLGAAAFELPADVEVTVNVGAAD